MKSYFGIVFYIIFFFKASCVIIEEPPLSQATEAILHRYYLIARLKKNITILNNLEKKVRIDHKTLLDNATSYFTHPEIRQTLQDIHNNSSFEPLWKLWSDIQAYKKVYDQEFSQEFARLILYIKHSIIHANTGPLHKNIALNNIDTIDIAYRFYLLHRLNTVFQQLSLLKKIPCNSQELATAHFKHKRILHCLQKMREEKKYDALDELIHEVIDFKHCHDATFAHEFLILLLIIHKNFELTRVEVSIYPLQTNTDIIRHEFKVSNNQFTNYVFRRYYYINRLQSIITLLQNFQNNSAHNAQVIDHEILLYFSSLPFQHPLIKQCTHSIHEQKNFQALFTLWNDFIHYRHIDDQLLTEEFIKIILVALRNLILSHQTIQDKEQQQIFLDFTTSINLQACAMLDVIDSYASIFIHHDPHYIIALDPDSQESTFEQIEKSSESLNEPVRADDIMERFYHIQRLTKHQEILKKAQLCNIKITLPNTLQQSFTHPKIIACAHQLQSSGTLDPLVKLGHAIEHYKYIQDTHFIKEFLRLLYISYMTFYEHECTQPSNHKSPTTFFQTLETLPLEEILQAIDILSKEIPTLIEKYELQSTLTWKQWLKKYWWVPPLTATTITLKILIAIKFLKYKGIINV